MFPAAFAVAAGVATALVVAVVSAAMRPMDGWPNLFNTDQIEIRERGLLPSHRIDTSSGIVLVNAFGGSTHTRYILAPAWTRWPDVSMEETLRAFPTPENVPRQMQEVFGNPTNYALPAWVTHPAAGAEEDIITTCAWGWPARCLYGTEHVWWRPAGSPKAKRVVALEGYLILGRNFTQIRRVPYHVIPTGLLFNTVLFAAAWVLLGTGLVSAGRFRWRRRGHCPACAYDLRGLVPGSPCPECGASTS